MSYLAKIELIFMKCVYLLAHLHHVGELIVYAGTRRPASAISNFSTKAMGQILFIFHI